MEPSFQSSMQQRRGCCGRNGSSTALAGPEAWIYFRIFILLCRFQTGCRRWPALLDLSAQLPSCPPSPLQSQIAKRWYLRGTWTVAPEWRGSGVQGWYRQVDLWVSKAYAAPIMISAIDWTEETGT